MTLAEGLVAFLKAEPAIDALIAGRVYPRIPGAATMPLVRFFWLGFQDELGLAGPSGVPARRVQLDCYGASYADAHTLGQAVKAALHGFDGSLGGVQVSDVFLEGWRDDFEEDGDTIFYRSSLDFMIRTHAD